MSRCTVYKEACAEHGFIHGAEANELREGIEALVKEYSGCVGEDLEAIVPDLEKLLERVDARDSIARLEHQLSKPLPVKGRVRVEKARKRA